MASNLLSSSLRCHPCTKRDAFPSGWMPPLGFVSISPSQEGWTDFLPKIVQVSTHVPHLQETELVLPPQHIQTLLKKGPRVSLEVWAWREGTGGDRKAGMGWSRRDRGLHSPALQMLAAFWPSGSGRDKAELRLWGCGAASATLPLTKMAAKGLFCLGG